jgi:DNA polymerase-3 subunit delta'
MFISCRDKQLQLSHQYLQNKLPHAVLINGVSGSGQTALSSWLINLLICQSPVKLSKNSSEKSMLEACGRCKTCLLQQSGTYPDHIALNDDAKTLGVDDIRAGNHFLEKTAQLGGVKTIFIPDAERLTIAAANALLKTLEEPSENSFIVLSTNDLDKLLPTIISRCAVFSLKAIVDISLFSSLDSVSIKSKLTSVNLDSRQNNDNFVNVSQLSELSDDEAFSVFKTFHDHYLGFLNNECSEHEMLKQLLTNENSFRWLEQITCNVSRKHYLNDDKNTTMLCDLSELALASIYQTIIDSNKLLKSYSQTNRQFVAEKLVMAISNIIRPLF